MRMLKRHSKKNNDAFYEFILYFPIVTRNAVKLTYFYMPIFKYSMNNSIINVHKKSS